MVKLLNPRFYGLPYKQWREGQEDVISRAVDSPEQVVVIEAPVGIGKTAIAVTTVRANVNSGNILTYTKSLQDRYSQDIERAIPIKGRNNYQCVLPWTSPSDAAKVGMGDNEERTVDNAPCSVGYQCPVKSVCPYFVQQQQALNSMLSIHNYPYWLAEKEFDAEVVVCDEGDMIASVLRGQQEVRISEYERNLIGMPVPDSAASVNRAKFKDLAHKALLRAKRQYGQYSIGTILTNKVADKLDRLALAQGDWVVTNSSNDVAFIPLTPPDATASLIRGKTKKLVIMSGTILDPNYFSKQIGVNRFEFIKMTCPFPKDNRLIVYSPVGRVTRDTMNALAQPMANAIIATMDEHPGEKGIAHTVSFNWADMISSYLPWDTGNIIFHQRHMKREEVIKQFRDAPPGTWIVSPSLSRGEDLPYDECRVQAITKMPLQNIGDPYVQAMMQRDKLWYPYEAMKEFQQTTGRVCRANDDYGLTVVLDAMFEEYYNGYPQFVADWVREAVVGI